MTTPNDRELLLAEIKSLARDVSRLRADTKAFVHEEVSRSRWRTLLLGTLAFLALAVPLTLFYFSEREFTQREQAFEMRVEEFARATVEACEIRNRALENDARFARSLIEALEASNADNPDPLRQQYLETLKSFQKGLGQTVDCGKREAILG